MFVLKVKLNDAEKAKKLLVADNLLNSNYKIKRDASFIYFPLVKKKKVGSFEIVEMDIEEKRISRVKNLRELLKDFLSEKELFFLKTSFDTVGSIAILEIDDVLRKKEKVIAEALLRINSNIKTVLRKDAGHEGEFRTQKMKWLAGVKTKETIHKENGVNLLLDVENVYFSPRLATERKRIFEQVKKNETVLVMFSGCGPYPCVLSKNTGAKEIVGIEINPVGHDYAVKNLELNKIKNVILINDDVKNAVPLLADHSIQFDRIVMPAPHNANSFIEEALTVAKKNTIIHFYDFLHEDNFADADKKVDVVCKKMKMKWKKISLNKAGQHAPHIFRICLDFKIL